MIKLYSAILLVTGFLMVPDLHAAKIGEISETRVLEQAARFFSFSDPSLRFALIGSILLGITCGLLGSFIVVKKLSLIGDTLSHAVLPGIVIGFIWSGEKNPVTMFIGAVIAGLCASVLVDWIKNTSRTKEDASLGIVLASFYAIGVALLAIVQRKMATAQTSGIDKVLFGQAAALSQEDVVLMAVICALTVLFILVFYKEFLLSSFDPGFASSIGLPAKWIHFFLMMLLAFAIVISVQAVGVVLVSAMLITPAAAAYLLTDRMHRMLVLAAIFGVFSGALGAFLSFMGNSLPTGPLMVIAATTLFALAYFFGPRHGIIAKWWKHRSHSARIGRENTLKAIHHILEARQFDAEGISAHELAVRRRKTIEESEQELNELRSHEMVSFNATGDCAYLTPSGWQRACEIVRNHRLWELYLTNSARIEADHVHDDAEKIEHVLGDETVRQLEKHLNHASEDPHGKKIPTIEDIQRGLPTTVLRHKAVQG